jgi:hypothetical protein
MLLTALRKYGLLKEDVQVQMACIQLEFLCSERDEEVTELRYTFCLICCILQLFLNVLVCYRALATDLRRRISTLEREKLEFMKTVTTKSSPQATVSTAASSSTNVEPTSPRRQRK